MGKLEVFFRTNKYKMGIIFIAIAFVCDMFSAYTAQTQLFSNYTAVGISFSMLIFCIFGLIRRDNRLISFGLIVLLGYYFINYSNEAFNLLQSVSNSFTYNQGIATSTLFQGLAELFLAISFIWMLYCYFVRESSQYNILIILFLIGIGCLLVSGIVSFTTYYSINKRFAVYTLFLRLTEVTTFISFIYMFFCLDNRSKPARVNRSSKYYS